MENLKRDVQMKFAELRNALYTRERLLLRQANVIIQQTKEQELERGASAGLRDVKFLTENDLLMAIRNFGRFQLDNINLTMPDVYLKNEDYISPANDHETMYKCLEKSREKYGVGSNLEEYPRQRSATSLSTDDQGSQTPQILCQYNKNNNNNQEELTSPIDVNSQEIEQPESIVVDISRNMSLIEHNAKDMNKSIINLTLQEAKELIKQAKMRRETPIPPLNLEEFDDDMESSIAEAVSSLCNNGSHKAKHAHASSDEKKSTKPTKKTSSNRFKPKITINNCNGTINLRNISNLTINCATEDSISAQIPLSIPVQQTSQKITTQIATETETENETENENENENELVSSSTNNEEFQRESNENSIINGRQKIDDPIIETEDSDTPKSSESSSNYSSSSSSRSQSKKHQKSSSNKNLPSSQQAAYHGLLDYDERDCFDSHAVTCDFYNRLLKEIKNSLRTKRSNEHTKFYNPANIETSINASSKDSEMKTEAIPIDKTGDLNSNSSSHGSFTPQQSDGTTSQLAAGRRLVLKNFENLRIVLEANSSDEENFHPVQIEQWLAEIISETDLEPMQNTEILEHSEINNESN